MSREKQKNLWEKNVRTLVGHGHKITLFVSLTKGLLENKKALDIVEYAISLGISYIQFERITSDGNAKDSDIIPSNREIDSWILELYQVTIENKLYEKINNMFLSELSESVLTANHTGNRCRNCEQSIITMNADGSLAGCPNSASGPSWGHISKTTETFIKSPKRLKAVATELVRKDECLTCEVQGICNGDCYKLAWDENCQHQKA